MYIYAIVWCVQSPRTNPPVLVGFRFLAVARVSAVYASKTKGCGEWDEEQLRGVIGDRGTTKFAQAEWPIAWSG